MKINKKIVKEILKIKVFFNKLLEFFKPFAVLS